MTLVRISRRDALLGSLAALAAPAILACPAFAATPALTFDELYGSVGVLGLTFTTKAADELSGRVRSALRLLRRDGLLPDELAELEPVVQTYHAYAAQLVRDHALRVDHEREQLALLEATNLPIVELPALPDGVDSGSVRELAELLGPYFVPERVAS